MAPNDVNNSLNVGSNNNDEPVDNIHDRSQQDGSTNKTRLDKNESPSNRVERNTWRAKCPTPNDLDDEPIADTVKVLRLRLSRALVLHHETFLWYREDLNHHEAETRGLTEKKGCLQTS